MPKPPLMERAGELVEEMGTRWKEIAEVIEKEGYRDQAGNPLSANALRKRWKRHGTHAVITRKPVKTTPSKGERRDVSDVSESKAGRGDLEALKHFLEDQTSVLKKDLKEFVREQVETLAPQAPPEPSPQVPGYPRAAPMGQRDETGRGWADPWRRVKLGGTVNHRLEKMFQQERIRRELSVSRMLDTVIWHYFGCPELSEKGSGKIRSDPR